MAKPLTAIGRDFQSTPSSRPHAQTQQSALLGPIEVKCLITPLLRRFHLINAEPTPPPFDQVRVSVELRAPPIKAGDPILRDVFRSGRVEPGALDPRQADILASTMAGRMRPVGPPAGGAVAGPGYNGSGASVGGGGRSMGMGGSLARPVQF